MHAGSHETIVNARTPKCGSRLRARWASAFTLFALAAVSTTTWSAAPTVVLIGEKKLSLPDGQHDWPDGVLKIERLLNASPAFSGAKIKTFPVGFPKDMSEIDDASVVVLYFGPQKSANGSANPAQDPGVRSRLDALMKRGVGLVALHQAFTVPEKSDEPFTKWLGGVRIAVTDHTIETVPVSITASSHQVVNGLESFTLLDEFYPTIQFDRAAKVTPVLSARLHVQHRKARAIFEEPAADKVIAWTHERADGGRAFAFSGGHYVTLFDDANVRTMLLNAILWAAKSDVPKGGAKTSLPIESDPWHAAHSHRVVLPAGEVEVLPQPWGKLQWFASRPLGNSTTMTVGQATISPGKENPPHWHPNCDEVLHVVRGHIMHRVGDKEYEMRAGDTVVIPEGTVHNARNIGSEDAVLIVSFNSADRVAIGE